MRNYVELGRIPLSIEVTINTGRKLQRFVLTTKTAHRLVRQFGEHVGRNSPETKFVFPINGKRITVKDVLLESRDLTERSYLKYP